MIKQKQIFIISILFLLSLIEGVGYAQSAKTESELREKLNHIAQINNNDTIRLLSQSVIADAKRLSLEAIELEAELYLALVIFNEKDFSAAENYVRALLPRIERLNNKRIYGIAYLRLGDIAREAFRFNVSYNYTKRSITLFSQMQATDGLSFAYNSMGLLYWKINNFDSALVYYQKGLELRERLGYKLRIGQSYNNLGVLFYNWGIMEKAIENYEKAIKIREEIGDNTGLSYVFVNLALSYEGLGDTLRALELIQKANEININSKDVSSIAYSSNKLGQIFERKNQLDSALYYYRESLKFYERVNEKFGIVTSWNSIGNIQNLLGQPEEALVSLKSILPTIESLNDNMRKAVVYSTMGDSYNMLKRFPESLKHYENSLELTNNLSNPRLRMRVYDSLASVHSYIGNYKTAFEYKLKHETVRDSLEANKFTIELAAYRAKYELEQKNRKLSETVATVQRQNYFISFALVIVIVLIGVTMYVFRVGRFKQRMNEQLVNANSQISSQNIELEQANVTKDKLFSIIAHDLKNPFHILLNYTDILIEEKDEITQAKKDEIIEILALTLHSTYILLDSLLLWAKSQRNSIQINRNSVRLMQFIEGVVEIVAIVAKKKSITIEVSYSPEITELSTIKLDEGIVGTIIRNLLSNAVKFSKKGSTVKLELSTNGSEFVCRVVDSGVGIREENLNKIFDMNFTTKGTSAESGTGLGLALCKELAEKHGGGLEVKSEYGVGSEFTARVK